MENDVRDPSMITPEEIIEGGAFITDMRFYTVMVDADMARDLLLFNHEPERGKEGTNRKASKVRIELYKKRMLAGEWSINPQPIVFTAPNSKGAIEQSDGQQRLKALIEADKEQPGIRVPFTVCIDAPTAAKMVIDGGKSRLPSDFLRMQGETNASQLSYALRLLYCVLNIRFEAPHSWNKFRLSPTAQQQFLADHEEIRSGLRVAYDCKLVLPPYIGAVVFYLISKEFDAFKAAEFLQGLEKGLEMKAGDPRWRLREYLSRIRMNHTKMSALDYYALTVMAANAWLRGDFEWTPPTRIRSMPKLHKLEDIPAQLSF